MNRENPRQPVDSKRRPLWLRIVLMILLILVVSVAFYMVDLRIIERLNQ